MTWDEIADEQRRAAMLLLLRKKAPCARAVCSRAYYAAYALLAGRAPAGMTFPNGWNNPDHSQIPGIVDGLKGIPKKKVKDAMRRLRVMRTTADYGVGQSISTADAKERVRDCVLIFREVAGR